MIRSENLLKPRLMTLLVAAVVAGCGGGGGNDGIGSGANFGAGSPTSAGAGTGAGATGGGAGIGRGPAPVNLGTAGDFVVLAKAAVSTTGTTAVKGNIGVSPAAASLITGFALIADSTNTFSTSSLVTGKVFAANYAVPTPSNLTTAVSNMETAYTDAAGRAADVTELGAGNIGGKNLGPATYKWSSNLLIPTNVTLTGGPNDVWIFQIAQGLTVSNGAQIILAGGAQAKNVFWQTFAAANIGTTSKFNGVILSQTSIAMKTGASITGRLLAQTNVTLDQNAVTQP